MIDQPIVSLINGFNRLPFCFTLQSCYGHFVYNGQEDPHSVRLLPALGDIDKIDKALYRIAYISFCIENSPSGRELLESLRQIEAIDPDNIQFCCAEWFWNKQVNSYALQVEPDRFKRKDTATVGFNEALRIERVRNEVFTRLHELLEDGRVSKVCREQ